MKNKDFFTESLIYWNTNANSRMMPWKSEKDPYKIWISEIILQQTRVSQGLEYFKRFINSFPDVLTLANADETFIYKHWEGLGYYSRCKNVIATSKKILHEYNGKFPSEYDQILSLKGIGEYTAAAIGSFAFNLPYAVLDGNVYRLLARFFGIPDAIDSSIGKKIFKNLSQELLYKQDPAAYNQAIMDFGAVICKPKNPLCQECPLQRKCVGFNKGLIDLFPVKQNKIKQKERFFIYLVIKVKEQYLINKRTAGDIWENLYEFKLLEASPGSNIKGVFEGDDFKKIFNGASYQIQTISKIYTQKLTHQLIKGQFIEIVSDTLPISETGTFKTLKQLKALPVPKFITSYLTDKNVSLNLKKEVNNNVKL